MSGATDRAEAEEEEPLVARWQTGFGWFAEDDGAVRGFLRIGEEVVVQRGGGEVAHPRAGGFFGGDQEEGDSWGGVLGGGVGRLEEGEHSVHLGGEAGFCVDGAAAVEEEGAAVEVERGGRGGGGG